jgi:hypothetical protein
MATGKIPHKVVTPREILEQIRSACRSHKTVIASPGMLHDALTDAVFWRQLLEQGLESPARENAIEELSLSVLQAVMLLRNSPAGVYYDTYDRMLDNVLALVEAAATGKMPARGIRFDIVDAGQKSRLEPHGGQTVLVAHGASDAELVRMGRFWRWQTSVEAGGTVRFHGRTRLSRREFHRDLDAKLKLSAWPHTQVRLADLMGMSDHTLRDYLKDYGPPWDVVKYSSSLADCEARGWSRPRN